MAFSMPSKPSGITAFWLEDDLMRFSVGGGRPRLSSIQIEPAVKLKSTYYNSDKLVIRVPGGAHFWNVLYPKGPAQSEALVIDGEDWRVDFAGADLPLLIAMRWYPDRRARHDRDLLRHYLSHLNRHVEAPVTWDDLWREHRLGLICKAAIPIFQQPIGNAQWTSS